MGYEPSGQSRPITVQPKLGVGNCRQNDTMPFDEMLAARIRAIVSRRKGFSEKKMFGGVGFLLGGNMCVGVWKEFLIVRLGPAKYDEALDEPHVKQFDITDKSMRGWIMVAPEGMEDDASLTSWVEAAIRFVRRLPAKK